MSEFFIQEKQLGRATRTIVKNEKGHSLFLMVGRWGNKGRCIVSLCHEWRSRCSHQADKPDIRYAF